MKNAIWRMENETASKISHYSLFRLINFDSETFLQGSLIDRLRDGGVLRGVADRFEVCDLVVALTSRFQAGGDLADLGVNVRRSNLAATDCDYQVAGLGHRGLARIDHDLRRATERAAIDLLHIGFIRPHDVDVRARPQIGAVEHRS